MQTETTPLLFTKTNSTDTNFNPNLAKAFGYTSCGILVGLMMTTAALYQDNSSNQRGFLVLYTVLAILAASTAAISGFFFGQAYSGANQRASSESSPAPVATP